MSAAAIGTVFVGLFSLFNIAGRFFWATFSDSIGRRSTYFIFFALGCLLYACVPQAAHLESVAVFASIFCMILTMYGGGFATIPAYLADMFGTQMVGAIHGRLLTAWSVAGILGPVLVNYINDFQIKSGVPKNKAYDTTLYVLAGLLVGGFICNLLVRPVAENRFMTDEELAVERSLAHDNPSPVDSRSERVSANGEARSAVLVWAFWMLVGIPLAWGVWMTVQKAIVLF